MKSTVDDRADLNALSHQLRGVAEALKRLPADHNQRSREIGTILSEIRFIAAKLRGH